MKAKELITGDVNENEEPSQAPAPPAGGPPRRPGGGFRRHAPPGGAPGGPAAPGAEAPVGLTPQEKSALKDLVLIDLLTAFASGDTFYEDLVAMALEGREPDRAQAKHFLDEAGKWAKRFGPDHNALMNKIATKA